MSSLPQSHQVRTFVIAVRLSDGRWRDCGIVDTATGKHRFTENCDYPGMVPQGTKSRDSVLRACRAIQKAVTVPGWKEVSARRRTFRVIPT